MRFLLYVLVGAIGGVLGGMGMGGGTLLIPLLTIFFTVFQHEAQGVNLIAFIPMAIVALVLHFKNKLVDVSGVLYMILPACVFSVLFSILAVRTNAGSLQRYFGIFLIALGVFQIVMECVSAKKNENDFKQNGKSKNKKGV